MKFNRHVGPCVLFFFCRRSIKAFCDVAQILDVKNVLVVVSRWFGGVLLGGDRFKHINNATRDALELGGFLDAMAGDDPAATKKRNKKSK